MKNHTLAQPSQKLRRYSHPVICLRNDNRHTSTGTASWPRTQAESSSRKEQRKIGLRPVDTCPCETSPSRIFFCALLQDTADIQIAGWDKNCVLDPNMDSDTYTSQSTIGSLTAAEMAVGNRYSKPRETAASVEHNFYKPLKKTQDRLSVCKTWLAGVVCSSITSPKADSKHQCTTTELKTSLQIVGPGHWQLPLCMIPNVAKTTELMLKTYTEAPAEHQVTRLDGFTKKNPSTATFFKKRKYRKDENRWATLTQCWERATWTPSKVRP